MTFPVSRTLAREIPCPACGAPIGEKCRNKRGGIRESNHLERHLGRLHKRLENVNLQLSDNERLRDENTILRGIIAYSELPCVYCGLSKDDMSRCASGFPGCGRADDMLCVDAERRRL
jgi:hypothetical protein